MPCDLSLFQESLIKEVRPEAGSFCRAENATFTEPGNFDQDKKRKRPIFLSSKIKMEVVHVVACITC